MECAIIEIPIIELYNMYMVQHRHTVIYIYTNSYYFGMIYVYSLYELQVEGVLWDREHENYTNVTTIGFSSLFHSNMSSWRTLHGYGGHLAHETSSKSMFLASVN